MKICAVYKITNTITGDFYIGSSKDVKHRWTDHKCPSRWKQNPNNPMYIDMRKYGVDKFEFEILAEVEIAYLKEAEQKFIEILEPTYNNINAKGLNIERIKETHRKSQKEYQKTDKGKETLRKYQKKYMKSEKGKEIHRKSCNKYNKTDKGRKAKNKYNNQLCCFNGEILTLHALFQRFWSQGIPNPTLEAKKYLVVK